MSNASGKPNSTTVAGKRSSASRARTGTVTRFIPNPIEPWIDAPTSVATATIAIAHQLMSIGREPMSPRTLGLE
jgi:hypothetical protein